VTNIGLPRKLFKAIFSPLIVIKVTSGASKVEWFFQITPATVTNRIRMKHAINPYFHCLLIESEFIVFAFNLALSNHCQSSKDWQSW
jgi:hypothetical protein